jgi:hypothetical protein
MPCTQASPVSRSADKGRSVRGLVGSIAALVLLVTSCGSTKHAGLSQSQAVALAKTRIEARLDPAKRSYYETSIWNVTAERGRTPSHAGVWLIGIWNGQAESGDCALVSRTARRDRIRLIPCAEFPKYAR